MIGESKRLKLESCVFELCNNTTFSISAFGADEIVIFAESCLENSHTDIADVCMNFSVVRLNKIYRYGAYRFSKWDCYCIKMQEFRFTNGKKFGIIRIEQDKKGMFP